MDAANVVLDDNTITSHIKRIRRKFQAIDASFDNIETMYGMGYRWKECLRKPKRACPASRDVPSHQAPAAQPADADPAVGGLAIRAADGDDAAAGPGSRRCSRPRRCSAASSLATRSCCIASPSCGANSIRRTAICSRRCCVTRPLLDGFADEWPQPSRPVPGFDATDRTASPSRKCASACMAASCTSTSKCEARRRALRDARRRGRAPPGESDRDRSCLTRDEFGRERAWSISAVAPGPLHRARVRDRLAVAATMPTKCRTSRACGARPATGYAIELRAPLESVRHAARDLSARRRQRDHRAVRAARLGCTPARKR